MREWRVCAQDGDGRPDEGVWLPSLQDAEEALDGWTDAEPPWDRIWLEYHDVAPAQFYRGVHDADAQSAASQDIQQTEEADHA